MEYDSTKRIIHPITTGTDPVKCQKLMHSAKSFGWKINNIAENMTWRGTDMVGPGGGHKVNLLKNYIVNFPPEDIILFTDAYDVFYADDIKTVYERYVSLETDILFAAEKNCWPDKDLMNVYPDSGNSYKYLNSGLILGSVKALNHVFSHYDNIADSDDDQRYYTKMFLDSNCPVLIKLDSNCIIFQTHSLDIQKEPRHGYQLYNPEVNYCPCIYHGNGGYKEANDKLDELYNLFFEKLDPLSKSEGENKLQQIIDEYQNLN